MIVLAIFPCLFIIWNWCRFFWRYWQALGPISLDHNTLVVLFLKMMQSNVHYCFIWNIWSPWSYYFADSGVSFGSVSVFFTHFCYDIDLMIVKPLFFRAYSTKYQIYFRVHVGKLGKSGISRPWRKQIKFQRCFSNLNSVIGNIASPFERLFVFSYFDKSFFLFLSYVTFFNLFICFSHMNLQIQ